MATKKISQLTETTSINGSDILPVVVSGTTKKITYDNFTSTFLTSNDTSSFVTTSQTGSMSVATASYALSSPNQNLVLSYSTASYWIPSSPITIMTGSVIWDLTGSLYDNASLIRLEHTGPAGTSLAGNRPLVYLPDATLPQNQYRTIHFLVTSIPTTGDTSNGSWLLAPSGSQYFQQIAGPDWTPGYALSLPSNQSHTWYTIWSDGVSGWWGRNGNGF